MTNWKRRVTFSRTALIMLSIWTLLVLALVMRAQDKPEAARRIDFTQSLLGLDGKPITNPNPDSKGEPIPITLSDVCVSALLSSLDEDKAVPATEKGVLAMKLYDLAHKIYKAKAAVLTAEEVALIEI